MSFYNEPVIGNSFFAREDILAILSKCAADLKEGYRHNVAIIGRGLIGKSSLLLHFLGVIKDHDNLIPVYINLRNSNFTDFVDNFISMLLYHSLKRLKELKKTDDLNYLKRCAGKVFPRSLDLIKRIKASVDESNFDEAYSDLWDLCVVINSESNFFPVIVLDEFDRISDFPIKIPFQVLGQKIMVQHKSLFVLSSSSTVTARRILSEKLSLLFGGFQTIDLGPLAPAAARLFIQQNLRGLDIPTDLIDFLITFTEGHPFYLNAMIERLNLAKEYGAEQITYKHLGPIVTQLLFHQSGAINQFFNNLMERLCITMPDKVVFDILKMLLKTGKVSDVTAHCKVSPVDLNSLLSNLLEVGVISKSGSLYAITDPVFRTWVEIKTKPKNLYFDFMPEENQSVYAREVEEKILRFKSENKRRLDEKVVELITSFKNDIFFIDQRMRILPRLNHLQSQRLNATTSLIIMQGKRKWLFVVSNSKIVEEDIDFILNKIKEFKYNKPRIILISTDNIDNGAKLLAKQKKLWIWNREELNRLFQFYKGYSAVIA